MKKLAWVLMFCCGAAYGQGQEWVARIANKSGGNVVLLGLKAGCKNGGLRAFTNASSGDVALGCWIPTDNGLMVFWDDGETRFSVYPYTGWEINPTAKRLIDEKTK